MNTIYKPKGAAAEYGDYAVNIYTGCPSPLLLLLCAKCPAPGAGGVSFLRGAAQGYCAGTAAAVGAGADYREAGPPVLHL